MSTYEDLAIFKTSLLSYLSCHACIPEKGIPFIALDLANIATVGPVVDEWGASPNANSKFNTATGGKSIGCYPLNNSSFGIATPEGFQIDEFCAIGLIDVSKVPDGAKGKLSTATSTMSVFCAACKPGYKAFKNTVKMMVWKCVKIANCDDGSQWLSGCSSCSTDNAYLFAGDIIKFDECVSTNDPNCYAVEISATFIKTCKICKKGFFLNQDGKCETISGYQCRDTKFAPFTSFFHNLAKPQLSPAFFMYP